MQPKRTDNIQRSLVVRSKRTPSATGVETGPDKPAKAGAPPRKHLAPGERERRIVEEAAEFFAEVGLDGRTRDLAVRMGVSQALIYRYFKSKDALITRVYETIFEDRWQSSWDALLADRTRPLADRLTEFYCAYAGGFNYVSLRLFMLAGLFDKGLAQRFSFKITDRIFRPIIGELRAAAEMPGFDEVAMTRGERELAMTLHGGIVFLGIRKFVYQMPLPDQLDDLVSLQIHTFLDGALTRVRDLSDDRAPETLGVPLLR